MKAIPNSPSNSQCKYPLDLAPQVSLFLMDAFALGSPSKSSFTAVAVSFVFHMS